MAILNLRHATTYRYNQAVAFGEHRMMFRPRDSHDLRLVDAKLIVSPPASVRWHHDLFGNSIAVAAFKDRSDVLSIVSEITVEHYVEVLPVFAIEPYAQRFPFSYASEDLPDLGRTRDRHYPDSGHLVDAWARKFTGAADGGGEIVTMDLLMRITQAICRELRYERRVAEGTQTPEQTLSLGSGSCRDYALLLMEAARTLGLAARFVSGYVYDPNLLGAETAAKPLAGTIVGTGETHAWAQVYLPGAGWVELDPTNGLIGGVNLIRVAVARDPAQAVPLSGTFQGGPGDFAGLDVSVQVTAQ